MDEAHPAATPQAPSAGLLGPEPPQPDGLGKDRDFEPLHPAALKASMLAAVIWWSVLAGIGLLTCALKVLISGLGGPASLAVAALWLLTSAALGALCFLWPRIRHRHTTFRVDERGLQIRRGVLWRSHVFVPRSRIQHTDVSQGPLERRFGIASLVVHTAGTHNAATLLKGLDHERAAAARSVLTDETAQSGDPGGSTDGV